ncbi:MHYT domain-containing protein [uncultured Rhodoblastus sp.]|uniref:MHYT domain-containing protein n=1 Tax=uncultured Rhodoblastus sp. TaxID=543037 RepID=UPI0025FC5DDD|nr:MHYT domain-containing protein [uncultured Rhodoblastus sp.]
MGHEPWLVALSVAMAIQGSYVGLQLAGNLNASSLLSRRLRLVGSATAFAVGIWSMHFIGMLAARLPAGVDFLVLPTLISFLICVIVVGLAVCALHMGGSPRLRLALGALAMGSGIFIMHYVGMVAVHANALMVHDYFQMALAFGIAVLTSGFALWLLNRPAGGVPVWLAACVLGLAVSGMHYTAMTGTSFTLCEAPAGASPPALSRDTLAIIVALIGFSVSGSFLLSLLPDDKKPAPAERAAPSPTAVPAPALAVSAPVSAAPAIAAANASPESDSGAVSRLGPASPPPVTNYESIIVEKDGKPRHILFDDIRSVRANAHYTFISDGAQEYFCKLSIGGVETLLASPRFMRVHRSFIVALAFVSGVRRQGENGFVDIAGAKVQCSIPIARGRIAALRQRIEGEKMPVRLARDPPFVKTAPQ